MLRHLNNKHPDQEAECPHCPLPDILHTHVGINNVLTLISIG